MPEVLFYYAGKVVDLTSLTWWNTTVLSTTRSVFIFGLGKTLSFVHSNTLVLIGFIRPILMRLWTQVTVVLATLSALSTTPIALTTKFYLKERTIGQ